MRTVNIIFWINLSDSRNYHEHKESKKRNQKRAQGVSRDYALDKHHKADDAPYGGGRGQVMLAEPLYLCHQALSAGEHVHTVFLSAQGQPFNQQKARELLAKEHFILVCGHYEGIDQRFIDECVDEEISIGDFVLTGGREAACLNCQSSFL